MNDANHQRKLATSIFHMGHEEEEEEEEEVFTYGIVLSLWGSRLQQEPR